MASRIYKGPKFTECFYCKEDLGINSRGTLIREAIKPPHSPYRWKYIGRTCELCEDKKPNYDKWRDKEDAEQIMIDLMEGY